METKERTIKFGNIAQDDFKPIQASSKDLQTISVSVAVSNVITKPVDLYSKFTGNHLESMMRPRIQDAVQSQVAKYTIEEFVEKRDELAKNIEDDIKASFEPYGVMLTNVSLTDHDFDDEYDKAVKAKKVAQQAVETEKANQSKKLIEAENRVKLMEQRIKEKQKEAEANKIETNSLTNELLMKQLIEKWNGELPKASGGQVILPQEFFGLKKQ